ncbi:hypothetical protein B2J88_47905 [Rhodococcus sp. SRB_17]|nr:hypothetical protein [Rhodococcus sp. SRB_17]
MTWDDDTATVWVQKFVFLDLVGSGDGSDRKAEQFFNESHPWSRNDFYIPWVLRQWEETPHSSALSDPEEPD